MITGFLRAEHGYAVEENRRCQDMVAHYISWMPLRIQEEKEEKGRPILPKDKSSFRFAMKSMKLDLLQVSEEDGVYVCQRPSSSMAKNAFRFCLVGAPPHMSHDFK